jgi:ubiquitin carboxyl-terminal hydrolase 36/42
MSAVLSARPGSLPNGTSGRGDVHSHGPLEDYLAHPLHFGPPVEKSGQDLEGCTRVVLAGPPSPGPFRRPLPKNEAEMDSSPQKDVMESSGSASTSTVTSRPSPLALRTSNPPLASASPSRARKEHPGTSTEKIHAKIRKEELDVSWPSSLASTKKSAAGLYNPSMACYANATLQVLLHTPPVLRIAQDHDPRDCTYSFEVCQT